VPRRLQERVSFLGVIPIEIKEKIYNTSQFNSTGAINKSLLLTLDISFRASKTQPEFKVDIMFTYSAFTTSTMGGPGTNVSSYSPFHWPWRAKVEGTLLVVRLPQMSSPILFLPPLYTVSQCPQAGVPSAGACHSTCVNSRTFTMTEAYLGC